MNKRKWKRATSWTPHDDVVFRKMWEDGMIVKMIETRMGFHFSTLRRKRKELGLQSRAGENRAGENRDGTGRLGVYFTGEERAELDKYCAENGLNVSLMVRNVVFREIRGTQGT